MDIKNENERQSKVSQIEHTERVSIHEPSSERKPLPIKRRVSIVSLNILEQSRMSHNEGLIEDYLKNKNNF